ncbi:hypothetical protein ACWOA5_06105 [Granulicatella adiacens]
MDVEKEELNFTKLDYRISHLTHDQIWELIQEYYAGEKVADLIKKYRIKVSVSHLFALFPPVNSEIICPYCNVPMLSPWQSKNSPSLLSFNETYCIQCKHKNSSLCNCKNCKEMKKIKEIKEKEEKERLLEEKRAFILNNVKFSGQKLIPEKELSLKDRLYLAVILRSSLSENNEYIGPLEEKKKTLAPSEAFEAEIIKHLIDGRIIGIHGMSNIHAFEVDYTKKSIHFDIYKVCYSINIEAEDLDYGAMIKRLLYPDFSDEDGVLQFCYEMWKRIALEECLEYLLFQMRRVGYSFNPGDKTISVFENLLEHFSVSQIYSLIYSAVGKSTQRYQSKEITKRHAQNSVISCCEYYGQKALAEDWVVKGYSRIRELPETTISFVLFTSIMQESGIGFSEKPTLDF